MVSEDSFFLTVRTVEVLSEETFPGGISSSSSIAAALFLPLIVLAGEGGGILFLLAEKSGVFFSAATLRTTTGFFGGRGTIEDVVDIFDFTEAMDGERFGTTGANFADSGVLVLVVAVDDGRFVLGVMEVAEAVDGTLGLEIVTFPIDGP
jgi:hypothetical protein